ncbi:hypothetical protein NMY22_g19584 [Coprinellus aureogranulatus]|nr:hypothetical protein NMY22_g19584 [Coprinellus aureogranulatus]
MSEEDRRSIGFSVIFVEHLLCKIVRWDRRLREDGCQYTLDSLMEKALEDEANGVVPDVPFPCDWKIVDSAIQDVLARNAHTSEDVPSAV